MRAGSGYYWGGVALAGHLGDSPGGPRGSAGGGRRSLGALGGPPQCPRDCCCPLSGTPSPLPSRVFSSGPGAGVPAWQGALCLCVGGAVGADGFLGLYPPRCPPHLLRCSLWIRTSPSDLSFSSLVVGVGSNLGNEALMGQDRPGFPVAKSQLSMCDLRRQLGGPAEFSDCHPSMTGAPGRFTQSLSPPRPSRLCPSSPVAADSVPGESSELPG